MNILNYTVSDIRTWHSNIEQHASEGVNKILIGNKSDWVDRRQVTPEQGQALANEFGIRFMETSAKVNEGVEDAFFTLARQVAHAMTTNEDTIDIASFVGTSRHGSLTRTPMLGQVDSTSRTTTTSKWAHLPQQPQVVVECKLRCIRNTHNVVPVELPMRIISPSLGRLSTQIQVSRT